MKKFKFENGAKLKDKITGFAGVVTGRADYITGCQQYCLMPKAKDESTKADATWFDEDRLEETGEPALKLAVTDNGGPANPGEQAPAR